MDPTETLDRSIKARIFFLRDEETFSLNSVSDAIAKIKEQRDERVGVQSEKILIDGEVVYFSDVHGEIERWENEWKRQKRIMSLEENSHDCPEGNPECYVEDLCMPCQLDKAARGVAAE
jgi:hypothetical protein